MSVPSAKPKGIFTASVLANRPVCGDHFALLLGLAEFPPTQPGQFVNIRCGLIEPILQPTEFEWRPESLPPPHQPETIGRQPLLRRPISLAGRRDLEEGVELEIIHRVVGVGTAWLAGLKMGQQVDILGPLGQGFRADNRPLAAVVGGGSGIPPMLYLAEALAAAGKKVVAFAGARSAASLPLTVGPHDLPSQAGWPTLCTAEFAARGAATVIATDDGSMGFPGLVSQALQGWMEHSSIAPGDLAVYACGPNPMMKAVASLCLPAGIPCQVSLERHMACGLGACQGCICKIKDDSPQGWKYKLVCKDGPVFEAREIYW